MDKQLTEKRVNNYRTSKNQLRMSNYKLVDKHAIEHHNEYYEVRSTQEGDQPHSLFFTTNEENLEDVATTIVAEHLPHVKHWTVIPHQKDS
ncbi:hypothetical protein GCM10028807_09230 [Spirosoma daeguense]